VAALLIGGLSLGLAATMPRHQPHPCFTQSKVDLARLKVREYVDVAYVVWRKQHAGRVCPASLDVLDEYLSWSPDGRPDRRDPWGNRLLMLCAADGIAVFSLGEDGLPYTSDDIRSWE